VQTNAHSLGEGFDGSLGKHGLDFKFSNACLLGEGF